MKRIAFYLIVLSIVFTSTLKAEFIKNSGQFNKEVEFVYKNNGINVFVCKDKLVFDFYTKNEESVKGYVNKMTFVNPNPECTINGVTEKEYFYNYINKNNEVKTNSYQECLIENIWDNINLLLSEKEGKFEYTFIVNENANPSDIKFKFENEFPTIKDKKLVLNAGENNYIYHSDLKIYQKEKLVAGSFDITGIEIGFNISDYNKKEKFIIDPLVFSTYLGHSSTDVITDMYVDANSNIYVCGYTYSTVFPTSSGAYDKTFNGQIDAFVSKFNPDGSQLLYSTYLGGSAEDRATGIEIDDFGNAYICGFTASSDFPTTPGSFDIDFNGTFDCFVSAFYPEGSSLIFSTYVGGADYDEAQGIDLSGNDILVCGKTYSSDFPIVMGSYDITFNGAQDIIVFSMNKTGNVLNFSTFLGGGEVEIGRDITHDNIGNVIVIGETHSVDYPVTIGAYDESFNGDADVCLSKLNSAGNNLLFSTFVGGEKFETGHDLICDATNNIYFCGETQSTSFPTTSSVFDNSYNGLIDGFVSRINSSGNLLNYSTFIGSNSDDKIFGIDIDVDNNVLVSGSSSSSQFPVTGNALYKQNMGQEDAVLLQLDNTLKTLKYSTFMGGSDTDESYSVSAHTLNSGYISGYTLSSDFPSSNGSYDEDYNGAMDGFIAKIDGFDYPVVTLQPVSSEYCAGSEVDVIFMTSSPFNPSNEFIAELSDETGNFSNPTEIGRIIGTVSGSIPSVIPKITVVGNGYRIRVHATDPEVTSDDTGNDFKVNALPTVVITGETEPCSENIYSYSCNAESNMIYQWSVNGGEFITDSLSPNVDIKWGINSTGILQLIKQNIMTFCVDTAIEIINIKFAPETEISWGKEDVCLAEVETYTAASSTIAANQWQVSGGVLLDESDIGKAVVLWTQQGEGWVELIKTNEYGCIGRDRKIVNVHPVPYSQFTGPKKVVEDKIVMYKTTYEEGVESYWQVVNGQIQGKNNLDSVFVLWGTKGKGMVLLIRSYTAINCSDTAEMEVDIYESLPDNDITGKDTVCQYNIESYQTNYVPDTRITWYADKGKIIGSNVGFTVSVNWNVTGMGTIRFELIDLQSGDTLKSAMSVSVRSEPEISFDEIPYYCLNDGPYDLEVGNPKGGTYSGVGVTDNKFYPQNIGIGKHTLTYQYIDNYDCDASLPFEVTVLQNPDRPTVSTDGSGNLISSYDYGNQWFFDGEVLPNETGKLCETKASGAYAVQHTDTNGCLSEMSDAVLVSVEDLNAELKIYPNPVNDQLNIIYSGEFIHNIQIVITDLLGKKYFDDRLTVDSQYINRSYDLLDLNNGIYIINLYINERVITKKIIINR